MRDQSINGVSPTYPIPLSVRQEAIRAIIKQFNTQAAVAAVVGKDQSTVSLWVKKGEIPTDHAHSILAAAANNGSIDVKPADFFAPRSLQAAYGFARASAA